MTGISGNKALIGYFVLWGTRQGFERRLLIILISLLILFFFFFALYFGQRAKTGVGQSMPCCMRTRMLRSHVGFDETASFQFPFLF